MCEVPWNFKRNQNLLINPLLPEFFFSYFFETSLGIFFDDPFYKFL